MGRHPFRAHRLEFPDFAQPGPDRGAEAHPARADGDRRDVGDAQSAAVVATTWRRAMRRPRTAVKANDGAARSPAAGRQRRRGQCRCCWQCRCCSRARRALTFPNARTPPPQAASASSASSAEALRYRVTIDAPDALRATLDAERRPHPLADVRGDDRKPVRRADAKGDRAGEGSRGHRRILLGERHRRRRSRGQAARRDRSRHAGSAGARRDRTARGHRRRRHRRCRTRRHRARQARMAAVGRRAVSPVGVDEREIGRGRNACRQRVRGGEAHGKRSERRSRREHRRRRRRDRQRSRVPRRRSRRAGAVAVLGGSRRALPDAAAAAIAIRSPSSTSSCGD